MPIKGTLKRGLVVEVESRADLLNRFDAVVSHYQSPGAAPPVIDLVNPGATVHSQNVPDDTARQFYVEFDLGDHDKLHLKVSQANKTIAEGDLASDGWWLFHVES